MRAISKNTRKATAITLAAALVIAVYLNWQYARTGVTLEEDAVNVSAVSQETVPVTDELMTEAEAVSSANKNYGEAQLVSVANNSGSKFFEEARLKRTKARHGQHSESAEIRFSLHGRKEGVHQPADRKPCGSQRGKRDRDTGQGQGVCGLSLLSAVRSGRSDCYDLGRCLNGRTGGADP